MWRRYEDLVSSHSRRYEHKIHAAGYWPEQPSHDLIPSKNFSWRSAVSAGYARTYVASK